jgi:ABC-type phosphate transport system permease subunit
MKRIMEKKAFENILRNAAVILVLALLALFVLTLFGGCTTVKTVEVERVRTDTVWQKQTLRDSIYLEQHDSIVLQTNGDTVTVERWHWRDRWRDRVKTDTIYKSKTDTVTEIRVTETRGTTLTWWQKVRMWIGTAALVLLVLLVVVKVTILLGPRR